MAYGLGHMAASFKRGFDQQQLAHEAKAEREDRKRRRGVIEQREDERYQREVSRYGIQDRLDELNINTGELNLSSLERKDEREQASQEYLIEERRMQHEDLTDQYEHAPGDRDLQTENLRLSQRTGRAQAEKAERDNAFQRDFDLVKRDVELQKYVDLMDQYLKGPELRKFKLDTAKLEHNTAQATNTLKRIEADIAELTEPADKVKAAAESHTEKMSAILQLSFSDPTEATRLIVEDPTLAVGPEAHTIVHETKGDGSKVSRLVDRANLTVNNSKGVPQEWPTEEAINGMTGDSTAKDLLELDKARADIEAKKAAAEASRARTAKTKADTDRAASTAATESKTAEHKAAKAEADATIARLKAEDLEANGEEIARLEREKLKTEKEIRDIELAQARDAQKYDDQYGEKMAEYERTVAESKATIAALDAKEKQAKEKERDAKATEDGELASKRFAEEKARTVLKLAGTAIEMSLVNQSESSRIFNENPEFKVSGVAATNREPNPQTGEMQYRLVDAKNQTIYNTDGVAQVFPAEMVDEQFEIQRPDDARFVGIGKNEDIMNTATGIRRLSDVESPTRTRSQLNTELKAVENMINQHFNNGIGGLNSDGLERASTIVSFAQNIVTYNEDIPYGQAAHLALKWAGEKSNVKDFEGDGWITSKAANDRLVGARKLLRQSFKNAGLKAPPKERPASAVDLPKGARELDISEVGQAGYDAMEPNKLYDAGAKYKNSWIMKRDDGVVVVFKKKTDE